jgi:ABC-type phosphate/phosphonate transport system substrate-binding protein
MYSWAPSLAEAWERLLGWVGHRAGVPLDVLGASDPTSLDDLWARDDMGCVFMCGYPWALRQDRPHLLAAPVPSPARYRGQPIYMSDFIVRASGPHATLEETFGGTIAYSTEHSHSGYNAPRYHLLAHRGPARPALYARTLGPLVRQRPVVEAVAGGRADVGAVDGYALDLLRRHDPELAGRVRVVATTVPAPVPPVVASPGTDGDARERITRALLAVHEAPELATTLPDLLLSRFVAVEAGAFQVFLDRQRAAEAAGYPKLA